MISNLFRTFTVASMAIATASLTTAPARAMSFFSFGGDARLENPDGGSNGQSLINFFPFDYSIVDNGQSINAGRNIGGRVSDVAPAELFDTKDIPLIKVGPKQWTLNAGPDGVPNFMSNFDTSTNLSSRLLSFDLNQAMDGTDAYIATLSLLLNDGADDVLYEGFFSSQRAFGSMGTVFSADLKAVDATAVPTPAMLPGLLGVTLGMIRKRKQQVA